MMPELVQWQKRDDDGIVMPWFTHDCLNEIKSWDLSDKKVLEWGGGYSTIWWLMKAKQVVTIETNPNWYQTLVDVINKRFEGPKSTIFLRQIKEGDQTKIDEYTDVSNYEPDIVVVDGILRYECIQKALSLKRPLTLIVDNWIQAFVFMCPAAEELLKDFERKIFEQSDHTDNDGINKWKTAIFYIK